MSFSTVGPMSMTDVTFFIPEIFNQILINRGWERVSEHRSIEGIIQSGRHVELLQFFPLLLASKTAFRRFRALLKFEATSETFSLFVLLIDGYPCILNTNDFDKSIAMDTVPSLRDEDMHYLPAGFYSLNGYNIRILTENRSWELQNLRTSWKNTQTPIFHAGANQLTYYIDTDSKWLYPNRRFDSSSYTEQIILDIRGYRNCDVSLPDVKNLVIIGNSLNLPFCFDWYTLHRTETLSIELWPVSMKILLDFKNIANLLAMRKPFKCLNISMLVSKGQAEAHFAEIITVIPNLFAEAVDTCTSADVRVYARFDVQLPWKAVENLVDHHRFYTKRYSKFYRMVSQHHRNLYYVCNVNIIEEVVHQYRY
uniref:FBA_2 domain-containing protein n=1 Tax=Panagrellus redivivus TaxID=6233 RepID=A0A7E4WA29_PANRE